MARPGTAGGSEIILAEVLHGRDNNFDLLRLIAALAVMYGHCYFLQGPQSGVERVGAFLHGEYPGSVSVYMFFMVSGMLISQSMERKRSAAVFVVHRLARIWPGLVFSMLLAFVVILPISAGISPRHFFSVPDTLPCLINNVTLWRGMCTDLSIAFTTNPVSEGFDFPLWTLPIEVHCYLAVLIYGVATRYRISQTAGQRWAYLGYTAAVLLAFLYMTYHLPADEMSQYEFLVMYGYSSYPVVFFLIGMILYGFRAKIKLNPMIAIALAIFYVVFHDNLTLLYIAFIYIVLTAAGLTRLRRWRPRHDYSYGIYINGFIVQQVMVQTFPHVGGLTNFLLSVPPTIAIAALSWHLVERPSLRLARRIMQMPTLARLHSTTA